MTADELINRIVERLNANAQQVLIPASLKGWIYLIALIVLGVAALILLFNVIGVYYEIWSSKRLADLKIIVYDKQGAADLAKAHNDQQVQVAEAKGRVDAARLNKEAEIIDAEAVAKSVEIIGTSLHNNHGYLQWKWIHMMEQTDNATIYVPTEASLPILEAGKRAYHDLHEDLETIRKKIN